MRLDLQKQGKIFELIVCFYFILYLNYCFVCPSLFALSCSQKMDEVDDDLPINMKGDAWFGSVKAAANLAEKGVEAVLQVKTGHLLYPKAFVEDTLRGCPGGVHIVLRGRHPNGKILIAIGYQYSSKKRCSLS